jgi:hypothetical protein
MGGYDLAVEHAQEQFAERFGGFTAVEAEGGWHNGDTVVTEPVTVLTAFGDVSHDNAVVFMDGVTEYIAGVNLFDEDAIMFTVDNSQYLVETDDGRLRGVA